jgi:hypothetical protein
MHEVADNSYYQARYQFCGRQSHLKQIGGYTRHAFRQLSIEELVLNRKLIYEKNLATTTLLTCVARQY